MDAGKLALSALHRLLGGRMQHLLEQVRHPSAGRKTVESEISGVSRHLTEDASASGIIAEESVLNTTPEREEDDKRTVSSSDCGEALGAHGHSEEASGGECAPDGQQQQHQQQLISQNVESRLREFLYGWGRKLVELQPKVFMSQHLVESGLFLFKCLRQLQLNACCEGSLPLEDLSNEVLLIHDLVACFWIAMKQCSTRTAVPNRTLVSKATGATPELLGERELGALILLDWDVNTLLRFGGFIV